MLDDITVIAQSVQLLNSRLNDMWSDFYETQDFFLFPENFRLSSGPTPSPV